MSDRPDIWKVADQLQMNHRVMGAQIVELRAMLAALGITADTKPPRAGSPHKLAPGCCSVCHVGGGDHAEDCHP
jgi:hypothetical protein